MTTSDVVNIGGNCPNCELPLGERYFGESGPYIKIMFRCQKCDYARISVVPHPELDPTGRVRQLIIGPQTHMG